MSKSSFSELPSADKMKEIITGEFDKDYYLSTYQDVLFEGIDPVIHYLIFGWKEGRNPTPEFSTSFYLNTYPDVANSAVNPFLHYILRGRIEGRLPKPLPQIIYAEIETSEEAPKSVIDSATNDEENTFQPEEQNTESELDDDIIELIGSLRAYFDLEYYESKYPDVAKSSIDTLEYFVTVGWRQGHDPTPDFSTRYYLDANPDVAEANINPFWHYVVTGKLEGRQAKPPQNMSRTSESLDTTVPISGEIEEVMNAIRCEFDYEYYNTHYPDVERANIDPLEHFVVAGWRESRNPNSQFSTRYYLDSNPDIAAVNINPFWHFVVSGRQEGRVGRHPGGYKADQLVNSQPLEKTVLLWLHDKNPEKILNASQIIRHVKNIISDDVDRFIISIGHDDYQENTGGIQVCIKKEEERSLSYSSLYLTIFPFQTLPRLSHKRDDKDVLVNLVLSGRPIGTTTMSELTSSVKLLSGEFRSTDVVIHHLLGHNVEQVIELVKARGNSKCCLWLHDFFTICPSFTLQRNGVSYCGVPNKNSNSCKLCLYGEERNEHQSRFQNFFKALQVHVLAPSNTAADLWKARGGLRAARISVIPHMRIKWLSRKPDGAGKRRTELDAPPIIKNKNKSKTLISEYPISVAFLGTALPYKGWEVFDNIVHMLKKNDKFRFYYFGTSEVANSIVHQIPVFVTAEKPDAMIQAVYANKIDLVVHWSSCPETFSLSAHEALAGGAFLVTNPISGNVAATVDHLGCGAVLTNERELEAFFNDNLIESLVANVRSIRKQYYIKCTNSQLSFPAIGAVR